MQSAGMVFGRMIATAGIFSFSTFIARELHTEDDYFFFKNIEDSNEMVHNAAFYQCLH